MRNLNNIAAILSHSKITLFEQDLQLRYLWMDNPPRRWRKGNVAGKTDEEVLPNAIFQKTRRAKEIVLSTGEAAKVICEQEDDGQIYEFNFAASRNTAGHMIGLVGSARNVTEDLQQTRAVNTLLREVSHRSKNLLAIVQSMASQTARDESSISNFLQQFNGRLQALSRSQDLITAANWQGATFNELFRHQVWPLASDPERQFQTEIEDISLAPNATLYLGLALYELASLSLQEGAIVRPHNKPIHICLSASQNDQNDQNGKLWFSWRDPNTPAPPSLNHREFGLKLLEKIVPSAVNGAAQLAWNAQGLSYQVTIDENEKVAASG